MAERETINNLPAWWYVDIGAICAAMLIVAIGLVICKANLTTCPVCERGVFAFDYCHDCGAKKLTKNK